MVDSNLKKLSVFIPILLTIVLTFSAIPNAHAQAPQFNLLPEKISTRVSRNFDVVVQIEIMDPDYPMVAFGSELDFDPDSMEYVSHTVNAPDGWGVVVEIDDLEFGEIDIYSEGYPGTSDPPIPTTRKWVTITFHCLKGGDSLITISGSIELTGEAAPIIINDNDSTDVHQDSPVGGVFYSADKVGLLSPYIALVGLIGAVSTIFAIRKWRKD